MRKYYTWIQKTSSRYTLNNGERKYSALLLHDNEHSTDPETSGKYSLACSSLLRSSIDHQPSSLSKWTVSHKFQSNVLAFCLELLCSACIWYITTWQNHYLDPRCIIPRNSYAFDDMVKYLPEPSAPTTKRIILSTNRYAANKSPTPWSKRRGVKRTQNESCLALGGVPWISQY